MVNQEFGTLHAANNFPQHQEIKRIRRVTCSFISHKITRKQGTRRVQKKTELLL
jgi:hypothetical protein